MEGNQQYKIQRSIKTVPPVREKKSTRPSYISPPPDGVSRRADRSTRSYNSRRSSTDSSEDGFNQNVRDLKTELKEVEEKFRKAMVANASLDNEKCQLMFQVKLEELLCFLQLTPCCRWTY